MVLSYLNIRIMAQRVFLAHGYKRQPMQVCHFDCHKINWMPISLSLKTAEQCWTSFLEVWRIPECVPLPVSFFIHHWFAVLCLHGMLRLTQTVTVAVTLEMMKPETVDPFVFILAYIYMYLLQRCSVPNALSKDHQHQSKCPAENWCQIWSVWTSHWCHIWFVKILPSFALFFIPFFYHNMLANAI